MTHTIGTAFIGFVLALALGSATYAIAAPVSVVQFTPHGETKQVRQVTARFSAPMVALGEPRAAAPFVVRCAPPGHGRWVDGYNWVYDFDAELPGGVRCSFVLRDRLTTLDKTAVTGERQFTFDTGGPAIQASLPGDGDEEIDERQAFLLRLDGTPTPATISQHAYCVIEGLAERVPVDVLSGPARQSILAQRERMGYAYYNVLWKNGEGSQLQVRDRKFEQAEARLTVVQCRRTLPPATKVQLVWDAGIAASSGVTTRTAQRLSFRVRPEFSARLTCTRTEPRAGCTPVQPITVEFNAPVPLAQALGVRLRIGPNDMRTPDSTAIKQAKVVQTLTFHAPFPESVTATLTLPEHLTDDAGRPLTNAPRFPLSVRIDAYPPLVKFAAQFGIVEAGEGGVLPVTLRNIDVEGAPNAATKARPTTINGRTLRVAVAGDSVGRWLRRVAQANESRGESVPFPDGPALPNAAQNAGAAAQPPPTRWRENTGSTSVFNAADATTPLVLPKPLGARPAEVVGIALGRPGLYIVELQSRRLGAALLGRDATRYVSSAALVTNLAVHLKWGRTGSRVWVTRLDTGAPVANAHVAISDYCTGKSRWQGDTGQDGVAKDTATLGEPTNTSADCDPYSDPTLIATATLGDDTGFVLSSWDNGIDPYHFGLETGTAEDTLIAHTVLDRALFRPGEKEPALLRVGDRVKFRAITPGEFAAWK